VYTTEDSATAEREAALAGQPSLNSHLVAAFPGCLRLHVAALTGTGSGPSAGPFTQLFAASAIVVCLDNYWPRLPDDARFALRTQLLEWLAARGLTAPPYVRHQVVTALARVTKLAWRHDSRHHVTVEHCLQFLRPGAGTAYQCLGLEVLSQVRGLPDERQVASTVLPLAFGS
jgi:hypothetical protein